MKYLLFIFLTVASFSSTYVGYLPVPVDDNMKIVRTDGLDYAGAIVATNPNLVSCPPNGGYDPDYSSSKQKYFFIADPCYDDNGSIKCSDASNYRLYYVYKKSNNTMELATGSYSPIIQYSQDGSWVDSSTSSDDFCEQKYIDFDLSSGDNNSLVCGTGTKKVSDHNSSICVCLPNYKPTPNPLVCSADPVPTCTLKWSDIVEDIDNSDNSRRIAESHALTESGCTESNMNNAFSFQDDKGNPMDWHVGSVINYYTEDSKQTVIKIESITMKYDDCSNTCIMIANLDHDSPQVSPTIDQTVKGDNPNDPHANANPPNFGGMWNYVNGSDSGGTYTNDIVTNQYDTDGNLVGTTTTTQIVDNSGALATVAAIADSSGRNHNDLSRMNGNLDNLQNIEQANGMTNHLDLTKIDDKIDKSNSLLDDIKKALIPDDSFISDAMDSVSKISDVLDDPAGFAAGVKTAFGDVGGVGTAPTMGGGGGGACIFTATVWGSSISFDLSMFSMLRPYVLALMVLFLAFFNFKIYAWIFNSIVHLS